MQDPAAVGVGDRVADVEEPPEELAEGQRPAARVACQALGLRGSGDGVLQAVAADEPHGVVGAAVVVVAQAVDRDDPGVLQAAGDLGLEEEPGRLSRSSACRSWISLRATSRFSSWSRAT